MIRDYNMAPHDAKAREKNPYWDDALEVLNGQAGESTCVRQAGSSTEYPAGGI